jgi:predicted DNA-binding protein YlxM (UPF0122 family)
MNVTLTVSIISISFCLFIFFYFKWYIKRRTSASELLAEYRTEVYRLIAEIDAATDRDSQLVEDRIKKLKEILEDTDKRLAVYVRELDRSRSGEALYTSLGKGIRAALNTEPVDEISVQVPPPAQAFSAPARPAPQLSLVRPNIEPAAKTQGEQLTLVSPTPSKRLIRAQIDELANEGLSEAEIASRLGISQAEVDLAMNLMRKQ